MDIRRSSPLNPGDRPGKSHAPGDSPSRTSKGGSDSVEAKQQAAEEARERRADELAQSRSEQTKRSQRVSREVRRAVREQLLDNSSASDSLDLSPAARAIAGSADDPEGDREVRNAHLATLKAAIESGSLHSPERIELAARRMLGDFS